MESFLPYLITIAIGAVAGWLAGNLVSGGGFGLVMNIVLGIVGAFVGSFIGQMFAGGGFLSGLPAWAVSLIWSTIGAVVVLLVMKLIKRA